MHRHLRQLLLLLLPLVAAERARASRLLILVAEWPACPTRRLLILLAEWPAFPAPFATL